MTVIYVLYYIFQMMSAVKHFSMPLKLHLLPFSLVIVLQLKHRMRQDFTRMNEILIIYTFILVILFSLTSLFIIP